MSLEDQEVDLDGQMRFGSQCRKKRRSCRRGSPVVAAEERQEDGNWMMTGPSGFLRRIARSGNDDFVFVWEPNKVTASSRGVAKEDCRTSGGVKFEAPRRTAFVHKTDAAECSVVPVGW